MSTALDLFDEVNESVTDWVNREDDRAFAESMVALRDRWAAKLEPEVQDALRHARDAHEQHVDLMAGCPLCELEAGHQRDRLSCDTCGELLDPDQPYDGHPECREQE